MLGCHNTTIAITIIISPNLHLCNTTDSRTTRVPTVCGINIAWKYENMFIHVALTLPHPIPSRLLLWDILWRMLPDVTDWKNEEIILVVLWRVRRIKFDSNSSRQEDINVYMTIEFKGLKYDNIRRYLLNPNCMRIKFGYYFRLCTIFKSGPSLVVA